MNRFLVAMAAAVMPLVSAAQTNLVTNGSFENYTQANQTWSTYASGNGWTTGAAGLEIRNNVAGTAADGKNFAELDTAQNSSIYQDISTVIGQEYVLTFSYANRTGVAVSSNGLGWSFGDLVGSTPDLAYNSTGDNAWSTFSVTWTATSELTRLSFSAKGTSDSYGSSLDNIRVVSSGGQPPSAVPEPATSGLMLIGLGALAGVRRRRQQNG
jgi:hypothetical protein